MSPNGRVALLVVVFVVDGDGFRGVGTIRAGYGDFIFRNQ